MTIYPPDYQHPVPEAYEKYQEMMREREFLEAMFDLRERPMRHQVCIKSIEVEEVHFALTTDDVWNFTLLVTSSGNPLPRTTSSTFTVDPRKRTKQLLQHCSFPLENVQSFTLVGKAHSPPGDDLHELPGLVGNIQLAFPHAKSIDPSFSGLWSVLPTGYRENRNYSVTVGDEFHRYTVTFCVREVQARPYSIVFAASGAQKKITAQEALDLARLVDAKVVNSNATELHVETYTDIRPLEKRWRRTKKKSAADSAAEKKQQA